MKQKSGRQSEVKNNILKDQVSESNDELLKAAELSTVENSLPPTVAGLFTLQQELEASIKQNEMFIITTQMELTRKRQQNTDISNQIWEIKKTLADLLGIPMVDNAVTQHPEPAKHSGATITRLTPMTNTTDIPDAYERRRIRQEQAVQEGVDLTAGQAKRNKFDEALTGAKNDITIPIVDKDGKVTGQNIISPSGAAHKVNINGATVRESNYTAGSL